VNPNVLTYTIVFAAVGWIVFVVLYGDEQGWGAGLTLGLAFGGFAVMAIIYVLLENARKRRRKRALPQAAAMLGLAPSTIGSGDLPHLPFDLMSKGLGRTSENVMAGYVGGPVWVFDYTYYTEGYNANTNSTSRQDHYFTCAVAELPAANIPPTRISREGFFSKIARGIGIEDVELGSKEFDRKFKVKSSNPAFAKELLDPGVQQWLMSQREEMNFEVEDRLLLGYTGHRDLDELRPLLDALVALRDQLPGTVLERFAPSETGTDQP
jgi:hypothetical protein